MTTGETMQKILISSFDMEVGGVERSLAGMLDHFDYETFGVDLMLYKHQGDFMGLLTDKVNLLNEIPEYTTFRKSISQTIKAKHYAIGISRLLSKIHADLIGRLKGITETGYYQMQLMWRYALPFLPRLNKEYDAAISYLWPHYFVAEKVRAKKKIAWIHTDYSTVETDIRTDLAMWKKYDHIIAVSDACRDAFLTKYGELENRVTVIENITSPEMIKKMAEEPSEQSIFHDKRFKIVTVARLSYAKGIDNGVKALKALKDQGYHDIAWYVVGYGGDEGMLRELVTTSGLQDRFILAGKQINPYPYIKACDLYVQPSRYEGKAVTVTEAKILNKPVLITNYPTAGSQVEDGVDGAICELSVEGIAQGILDFYHSEELRNRLTEHLNRQDYGNSSELKKLYNLMAQVLATYKEV